MQTELVNIIWGMLVIVGLLITIWHQYQKWRMASTAEKLSMVRNLVTVAEQVIAEPGSGKARFAYVINKLVKQYPKEEYEHLSELIEAAVYELNQAKGK